MASQGSAADGKATNGSGGIGSSPATNGKSYPIEDHTYDVVVVGAGGEPQDGEDRPERQRDQGDRGDALADPSADPVLGRAQTRARDSGVR